MTSNSPHPTAPAEGRWTPVLSRPAYPPPGEPEPIAPEPEETEPEIPVHGPDQAAPPDSAAKRRVLFWGLIAATATAATAATAVGVTTLLPTETVVVAVPPSASKNPPATPAPSFTEGGPCVSITSADKVQGNGPGSTESGPAAILAFEHAYYRARSGTRAREVVAPDAAVSPAETIQSGIDSVPAGTEHCVTITPHTEPGRYVAEIVARHASGSSSYRQLISTTSVDGRTLIANIVSAPR